MKKGEVVVHVMCNSLQGRKDAGACDHVSCSASVTFLFFPRSTPELPGRALPAPITLTHPRSEQVTMRRISFCA